MGCCKTLSCNTDAMKLRYDISDFAIIYLDGNLFVFIQKGCLGFT